MVAIRVPVLAAAKAHCSFIRLIKRARLSSIFSTFLEWATRHFRRFGESAHKFLLANYTSPLDDPDVSLLTGQTSSRNPDLSVRNHVCARGRGTLTECDFDTFCELHGSFSCLLGGLTEGERDTHGPPAWTLLPEEAQVGIRGR